MIEFDKLELNKMTWREIFDVIQSNFEKVYNMILANAVEVYIEQFEGGNSVYELVHNIGDETTLLIFRGNEFLGGKEGSTEYAIEGNIITFNSVIPVDDMVTVQILQANALANISQEYVNQIKEMYDDINKLGLDSKELLEEIKSLKDSMMVWGRTMLDDFNELKSQVQNIQTRTESTRDYIEELMKNNDIGQGSVQDEIIASRRGYLLLGERLDNMPFKFQSIEEMRHTEKLREGDVVLVGNDDYIITYKIMAEYSGPIQNVKLDNNLIAVRANSSIQVGEYQEELMTEDDERPIYVKVGTEENPIILSELSYGNYFVVGYYRIHEPEHNKRFETPINVQVVWSNVGTEKIRTITVGTRLYVVRINGLMSTLTEIPEIGNTKIDNIGDGTITGAIQYLMNEIQKLKSEE